MPALAWLIFGGVAAAFGLRQLGETVESTGSGVKDAAIAVAVIAGAYVVLKKSKVL